MKNKLSQIVLAFLLLTISHGYSLTFSNKNNEDSLIQAKNKESFKLLSSEFTYNHSNDNSPFDDMRSFNKQKRDDNGLTFSFGLENTSVFQLNNGHQLSVNVFNQNTSYTKLLGTETSLKPGDDKYSFYEYILKIQ